MARNQRIMPGLAIIAVGVAVALMRPAYAQDVSVDPGTIHGKRLFLMCAGCHSLHEGEPDKVGPNLHALIGSAAGSRGTFAYSESLKRSGIIWTPKTLDLWLKQPSALAPGTKMAFPGVPNDRDRADITAYLAEATR